MSEQRSGSPALRPAYYAAGPGRLRDWWTLLHPPYTAWHLSYVVIGAALAPRVSTSRLVATLLAFFCAVGLSAHALDELKGRPLRTSIPSGVLVAATLVGLVAAVAFGIAGVVEVGWVLVPFIVAGPLLVVAYNAELFGGFVHTDAGFALAWGAFPVLTAYVAQAENLGPAPVIAAVGAFCLSYSQRALSTPARLIRRRVTGVEGNLVLSDGSTVVIDERFLIRPLERALSALSWSTVLFAAALAVAKLG